MSMALIAVGTTIVGAGASVYSANKASKEAKQSSANSIAFEQQKLDDWNATYGPVEDNLSEYYNNLTPEYYEAVGLENFAQEQQTTMARLDESLAQRGLDPASGISASLHAQSELEGAETRAAIRRDAPRAVAEDKSRFLSIGLGQNPGSSLSNEMSNQASESRRRATASEQVAGQAIGSAISTTGSALADYANTPDYTTANAGQTYDNPNVRTT